MKYPTSLQLKLEEVREITEVWPVEIDFKDIIKWIMQFEPDDYDIAIRIIQNLNVIGHEDLKNALSIAYSKLIRKSIERGTVINQKNTLFAALGENGKSGAMVSYNFRMINELSEENFQDNEITDKFIQEGLIENIVLMDDLVSTGLQATKNIKDLTEKVIPYGVKNIFLLTICGFKEGLAKVQNEANVFTFSAFEYDRQDTITSLDSKFYDGIDHEHREKMLKRIQDYGSICYKSNPLGYGGIGALIAFYYNTPNTTIPVVWSDINSWIPLFRRTRRINGITSYYKQFDKAIKEKTERAKKQDKTDNIKQIELTIFVEGKLDELFFDLLVKEFKFNESLGYKMINIIALGGATYSDRLINRLIGVDVNSIFILDNDELNSRLIPHNRIQLTKKVRHVLLQPSIMEFFDIEKIIHEYSLSDKFPEIITKKEISPRDYYKIEDFLFKRHPLLSYREQRLRELIPGFINRQKVEEFVIKLREELDKRVEKNIDNININNENAE
jgi:hypothetical protein